MSLRRNILIFHQAALGDFIVTWPLAMALARMYPQSRVSYVTASSKGKLAERVLGVESRDAEQGWHLLVAANTDLPDANQTAIANAHLIVAFGSPDANWDANVRAIAPGATLIRLDTKPQIEQHITAHLLELLAEHRAIQSAMSQMLSSVASRGIAYRRSPQDRIVIHPGAGKQEKCWPVEKFVELIEHLRKTRDVRVLLGEVELDRWGAQAIARVEAAAEVARPATYLELLDEIAQAGALIGNDSGPAQLAGIIGVPTIALFGSSPASWKPLGPRVKVICNSSMSAISVGDVLQAARPESVSE